VHISCIHLHAEHTLCIDIKDKVALHACFLCKSRVTELLCAQELRDYPLVGWSAGAASGPFVADCSYIRAGQIFAEWGGSLYKSGSPMRAGILLCQLQELSKNNVS